MTTNDQNYEVEDFDKTITFESGQFAIVDAEVLKALKDQVPLAEKAVFVATKHSRDNSAPFKIVARYDDATLRKLVIAPASADEPESSEHPGPVEESYESRRVQTRKGSGVQKQGKGGDVVQRKTTKGKVAGARPKPAKRSERNKKGSAQGDQKAKLTKGKSSVEQRVEQAISHQGAELANFGQPKVETECMDLLARAKADAITEEYLDSLENTRQIRSLLADIRDNSRVKGKSFDLVYKTVQILDEHWHQNACKWVESIETLIEKGMLDV